MICIDCKKREGRTPKTKRCNSCYVKLFHRRHPEKYKYRFGGNKAKAFKRDNYKCTVCNENNIKILCIHHKDRQGSTLPIKQQNNNLDNLITLCSECHSDEHKDRSMGRGAIQNGKWSVKYAHCVICETTDRRHYGNGLCSTCFERKNKRKEYKKEWHQKRLQKKLAYATI